MVQNACSLPKVSILVSIKIKLAFNKLEKQKREENQLVPFSFPAEALCIDNFSLAN